MHRVCYWRARERARERARKDTIERRQRQDRKMSMSELIIDTSIYMRSNVENKRLVEWRDKNNDNNNKGYINWTTKINNKIYIYNKIKINKYINK